MKIKYDDIKVGQKVKAVSTYWPSNGEYQETVEIVQMVDGPEGTRLYKEDDTRYHVGINSVVTYETL